MYAGRGRAVARDGEAPADAGSERHVPRPGSRELLLPDGFRPRELGVSRELHKPGTIKSSFKLV